MNFQRNELKESLRTGLIDMAVYESEEPVEFQCWPLLILERCRHQVEVPYVSVIERPGAKVGSSAIPGKIVL
jgi:hypothetical protein